MKRIIKGQRNLINQKTPLPIFCTIKQMGVAEGHHRAISQGPISL
jgi:hypothetical protein